MVLSAKDVLDNLSWGNGDAQIECEEQHEVAAMQLNNFKKWTSKWTVDDFRLTQLVGGVSILQARGFILTKMQAFEKIKRIDDRYRKQKRQLKEVAARSEQQITRVAESQREGNLLLSQIAEHFVQMNRILADGVSVQKAAMHLAMERHAETSDEELEESADSCGEPHPSSASRQDAKAAWRAKNHSRTIDDKIEKNRGKDLACLRGRMSDSGGYNDKSNGNSVRDIPAQVQAYVRCQKCMEYFTLEAHKENCEKLFNC